jgi:flagellar hook protein FlgE
MRISAIPTVALSGLQAAQKLVDVSANNIANAQTPGYRRQMLQQQAQATGGVSTSVTTAVSTAVEPGENLSTELVTDLVQQRIGAASFAANLQVFKAHDAMLGTLLDQKV